MFGFKKKKKKENSEEEETGDDGEEGDGEKKPEPAASGGGDASVAGLSVKIEKINASIEAFAEVRKSFGERFNHITEQISEVRTMILDRDKSIQEIELKAVKAHDLVETVQPDKMMTQLQKGDARIEALKANIEGNEAIMGRVMDDLKDIRRQVEFFRGIEEIVKLSEETKKDLIEVKKVGSKIALNADKVETIYAEMRMKFQKVDMVDSALQELKAQGEQGEKDIQILKEKAVGFATKENVEEVVKKVQRYVDVLKGIEKKSSMTKDIDRLKDILDGLS